MRFANVALRAITQKLENETELCQKAAREGGDAIVGEFNAGGHGQLSRAPVPRS